MLSGCRRDTVQFFCFVCFFRSVDVNTKISLDNMHAQTQSHSSALLSLVQGQLILKLQKNLFGMRCFDPNTRWCCQ